MQNQKAVNSEGEVGITEDELSPCVQEKKKKCFQICNQQQKYKLVMKTSLKRLLMSLIREREYAGADTHTCPDG